MCIRDSQRFVIRFYTNPGTIIETKMKLTTVVQTSFVYFLFCLKVECDLVIFEEAFKESKRNKPMDEEIGAIKKKCYLGAYKSSRRI